MGSKSTNIPGFCLFCLQFQEQSTLSEINKNHSKTIQNFQPIVNYLTGNDPTINTKGLEGSFCKGKYVPLINELPPICSDCLDLIKELHRLHELLFNIQRLIQTQTELIRGKIKDLHCNFNFTGAVLMDNSIWKQFQGRLSTSGMGSRQISSVCQFVKSLHDPIIAEGSKQVIYPSRPPPLPAGQNQVISNASEGPPLLHLEKKTANPAPSSSTSSPCNNQSEIKEEMVSEDEDGSIHDFEDFQEPCDDDNISNEDLVKTEPETEAPAKRKIKSVLNPPKKYIRRTRPKKEIFYQKCDLCGKPCAYSKNSSEIEAHLREHVKEYVVGCLITSCPFKFSCLLKRELHLRRSHDKSHLDYVRSLLPKDIKEKTCSICAVETKNLMAFKKHLETHEKDTEKIFPCPVPECSKIFGLRESVDLHIFYHNLRPPKSEQECPVCNEKVKVEDIAGHLKDNHEMAEIIPCKHCKFIFPSDRVALIEHIYEEHQDEEGVCCDICQDGIKYVRRDTWREHYFLLHNVGEMKKSCVCEFCFKEFDNVGFLNAHKRKLHLKQVKAQGGTIPLKRRVPSTKYLCELCPDLPPFNAKDGLTSHKIKTHGADPLTCKHCSEVFTSAAGFRKHQKNHTGLSFRSFRCTVEGCNEKAFPDRAALQRHHRSAHAPPGTERPFQCDQCPKSYWDRNQLTDHQKNVHEGLRPHMCETCGKSFTERERLKRHKIVHSELRPFQCQLCSQTFKYKNVLQTHLRSHEEKGSGFRPSGPMKR